MAPRHKTTIVFCPLNKQASAYKFAAIDILMWGGLFDHSHVQLRSKAAPEVNQIPKLKSDAI